jgi:hypothetical protein
MKKKQIGKICSLLFSAAVIATAFPTDAFAAELPGNMERTSGDVKQNTAGFAMNAQLFNDAESHESAYREAAVTEETAAYQGKDWTVVNLTFESADASKAAQNLLRIRVAVPEDDIVVIGTGYDKTKDEISSPLDQAAGEDNVFYSKSNSSMQHLGIGNGPAEATKSLYCLVTHGDGTKSYYKIVVLRKGYKGVGQTGGNSYSLMNYDAEKEWFADMESWLNPSGTTYDEEGKRNGTLEWVPIEKDKTKDIMWLEDNYVFARRAGTEALYKASYNGEEYYYTAIAKYKRATARTLLDRRKTDGVTKIGDFADADAFAAEFPAGQAERAGEFFSQIQKLEEILNNNVSDINPGGWDYLLYQDGVSWSEECESAQLNHVMDAAPGIWENIYDKKGTKEAIRSYRDLNKYPLEQQAKLQAIIEKYTAQVDSDYETGVIKSIDATHAILENAKKEMDAIRIPLDQCRITLDASSVVYDGTEKKPAVRITGPDKKALKPEEYTVTYTNNIHAGDAKATVTGAGEYAGSKTVAFTISKAAQVITTEKTSYICAAGDSAFSLKASVNSGKALSYRSSDDSVAGVSADGMVTPLKEGAAAITIKADGDGDYLEQTITVNIQVGEKQAVKDPQNDPQDNARESLLTITKKAYTKTEGGKAFSLGVKAAKNVTVAYKTSAKKVAVVSAKGKVTIKGAGRAVITVTAKAKSGETQKESITIDVKPSAKLGLSVKAGKKQLKISWKKNKNVTGYEITVATDKKFKKNVKKVTIKKAKTVKTTVKKLKAKKKYYVRIRSYKKVSGKTLYSKWTAAKTGKPKA